MPRTEPVRGNIKGLGEELEYAVAQGVAGMAECGYRVHLCGKGFRERLAGLVAVEFAHVERSGGERSDGGIGV